MFFKRVRKKFRRFIASDIGIDLGTANTVVYVKDRGIVLNEPSVVAMINENGVRVPYLFGKNAKSMLGKTPAKIDTIKPLKDGVVADFNVAEEMIRYFIKAVAEGGRITRPLIIVGVPSESTTVERRAIQDTCEKSGARDVYLIEEPMAAAIGAGLPVDDPSGSMVIDIGGGTTEIAVISLGGIIYSKSLKVGGNKMDTAIIEHIRHKYNLLIGETTAENIKKNIGIAYLPNGTDPKTMQIKGQDLINGVPKEVTISQEDIVEALYETISAIVEAVRVALESIPPELSSDIVDRGIVMTGGGALLANLDYVVSAAAGLSVFVAKDALLCVANGIGKVVENYKQYLYLLFKQM